MSDSRRVLVQYNTNRGCRAWVKPTLSHISTVKSINFWLLNDLEPRRCRRPSPRPRLRIDGVQYRGRGCRIHRYAWRNDEILCPPPPPPTHYFFSPATAQVRMPSASSAYLCFTNHRLNLMNSRQGGQFGEVAGESLTSGGGSAGDQLASGCICLNL